MFGGVEQAFRRVRCARLASGFTLLELLNAVSLAAVISALAMYGLGRYIRHAKTAEALGSVSALSQAALAYYNDSDATQPAGGQEAASHAMRHFPAASRASVPVNPDDVRGRRYQSTRADWSASPWRELNFSIPQPAVLPLFVRLVGDGEEQRGGCRGGGGSRRQRGQDPSIACV